MAENKRGQGQSNPGSQSGQQKQRGDNPSDQTKNRKQQDRDLEDREER